MMSERDRILAAEFVSGLLDPTELSEAERRLVERSAFAQEVAAWRARLSDFDDSAPEISAGPALLQRIEDGTRLAAVASARRSFTVARAVEQPPGVAAAPRSRRALTVVFALTSLIAVQSAREEIARKPIYVAISGGRCDQECRRRSECLCRRSRRDDPAHRHQRARRTRAGNLDLVGPRGGTAFGRSDQ